MMSQAIVTIREIPLSSNPFLVLMAGRGDKSQPMRNPSLQIRSERVIFFHIWHIVLLGIRIEHIGGGLMPFPKQKNGSEESNCAKPRDGSLSEWLHFFNHAHEEDETMRAHYTNPMIHKAFGILERLSADEETRLRAEMRERAIRDEVSMLAAAERKGIEIGKKETAKNLVALGKMSMDEIAQVTGLSVAEIMEVRSEK
jgi:hypothetical protein